MAVLQRGRKTTWIKFLVRERDGNRCVDCGMAPEEPHGDNLQVHRLVPGSRYTLEGCVTLCSKCHSRRHWEIRPRPTSQPGSRRNSLGVTVAVTGCNPELKQLAGEEADRLGIPLSELVLRTLAVSLGKPNLGKPMRHSFANRGKSSRAARALCLQAG